MSRSTSKPVEFEEMVDYGQIVVLTVTYTHCRSSDTVAFDFSDGEHLTFSDEKWAAMTKADENAEGSR